MASPGFFQRQASARRNTGLLVVLFLTAVTLITLAVCLVGYMVTRSQTSALPFHYWLLSSHGLTTAGAVVALIGIGSLVRWVDLAGGGTRVARMVGARAIDPDTRDPEERKLRNIVEEMSIASGVPVPELYVMDHETGKPVEESPLPKSERVGGEAITAVTDEEMERMSARGGGSFRRAVATTLRADGFVSFCCYVFILSLFTVGAPVRSCTAKGVK